MPLEHREEVPAAQAAGTHRFDHLCELCHPAVSEGMVDQLPARRGGRQPLDQRLELRISAEDTAAPVASGEAHLSVPGVLTGVSQAGHVRLQELPQDALRLVLPRVRQVQRIEGNDVRAPPPSLVRRGVRVRKMRAIEVEAVAVAPVAAVLPRADNEHGLVRQHDLAEQHTDKALWADHETDLLLHGAVAEDSSTEVLVGKVGLQVPPRHLDQRPVVADPGCGQRLVEAAPEVLAQGVLCPPPEGHDLLQLRLPRGRDLREVREEAEHLLLLLLQQGRKVEGREVQGPSAASPGLALHPVLRERAEEGGRKQGPALPASQEDLRRLAAHEHADASAEQLRQLRREAGRESQAAHEHRQLADPPLLRQRGRSPQRVQLGGMSAADLPEVPHAARQVAGADDPAGLALVGERAEAPLDARPPLWVRFVKKLDHRLLSSLGWTCPGRERPRRSPQIAAVAWPCRWPPWQQGKASKAAKQAWPVLNPWWELAECEEVRPSEREDAIEVDCHRQQHHGAC
mmetsp:Transcript_100885/g.311164  ORF Transcript_100885/g.311164 Transcript_100885/m.311164 type:complete len:515 (+) Transcript_100885:285-1829(+)